jgi:hypothetical protein
MRPYLRREHRAGKFCVGLGYAIQDVLLKPLWSLLERILEVDFLQN